MHSAHKADLFRDLLSSVLRRQSPFLRLENSSKGNSTASRFRDLLSSVLRYWVQRHAGAVQAGVRPGQVIGRSPIIRTSIAGALLPHISRQKRGSAFGKKHPAGFPAGCCDISYHHDTVVLNVTDCDVSSFRVTVMFDRPAALPYTVSDTMRISPTFLDVALYVADVVSSVEM